MRLNETILVFLDSVDADSPNHMEKQTNWFYLRTRRNTNHSSFDIFFKERSSDSSISQMQLWKRIAIAKSREFSAETILLQWTLDRSNGSGTNAYILVGFILSPHRYPVISLHHPSDHKEKKTLFSWGCWKGIFLQTLGTITILLDFLKLHRYF